MSRSPFADFTARYKTGEVLFSEGDEGSTLFVVQSGSVELHPPGQPDAPPLALMEKGDFFGEMSLLEGAPRSFTARVAETADIIEISPALFDRMIRSNIELAVRMLRKLSFRLRAMEDRLGFTPSDAAAPGADVPPAEAAPAAAEPAAAAAPAGHAAPDAGKKGSETEADATQEPPAEKTATVAGSDGKKAVSKPKRKAPAAAPGTAPGQVWLVNPDGPEVFQLSDGVVHVGRFDPVTGSRPDVDLTLLDLKRSVSRRHAVLTVSDQGTKVTEEVGALNGTSLNGEPLGAGEPVLVKDGDELSFGSVILRYQTSAP